MNFYLKVLTKFASHYDLNLTLNLEITNTDGISWQRIKEMQAAMRAGIG